MEQVLMGNKLICKGWQTGLPLVLLGMVGTALGVLVPFVVGAPILAFFLMSVPLLFSSVIALLHGAAVIPARIAITDADLRLTVPRWRVFPMPPVRNVTLGWDELLAVRHRLEIYQAPAIPFLASVSFPVQVYAIDTRKGRVVLGGRSIPCLQEAVMEIVRRAGVPFQDEGEVKLGLIRSLFMESPRWGEMDRQNSCRPREDSGH